MLWTPPPPASTATLLCGAPAPPTPSDSASSISILPLRILDAPLFPSKREPLRFLAQNFPHSLLPPHVKQPQLDISGIPPHTASKVGRQKHKLYRRIPLPEPREFIFNILILAEF